MKPSLARIKDLQGVIQWRFPIKRTPSWREQQPPVGVKFTQAEMDVLHRVMLYAREDVMRFEKENSFLRIYWSVWTKLLAARVARHKETWNLEGRCGDEYTG